MNKILVSIIVPVYNVEKYLKRCLDTVVVQTLKEIEIILIDDGSQDKSGQICDEYKEKYPDIIKVIHQENQGLGPARNAGLEIASGEYIGFIDSDDWITTDMYEKLYNYAIEQKYDLVFSDMFYVDAKKSTITKVSTYYKHERCRVTSEQALTNGVYCYVWNKLYKSELIKNKRFPNLVFEDIPVITQVMADAKRIGYLPEPFYFYERKPGTLSTTYKSASMLDTIDVEELALEKINKNSREVLLFAFAKRFLQNMFSERKVMAADLVEHINKYEKEIRSNSYIKKHKDIQRIYKYLGYKTIPKIIYYGNFGRRGVKDYEKACIDSWNAMTRGFDIVELNEKNCNLLEAPDSVKQAYDNENYQFVNDYFKLKKVYETGGLAVDPSIYFSAPIGQLRMETSFWGFKNKCELLTNIYGSVSGTSVIKTLLETYNGDSIYKDNTVGFEERLTTVLIHKYGLNNAGWTQTLNENIKIFKCDTLAYDMQSSNNITKILNEKSYQLLDTEYEIIDKTVLKYWSDDKDNFWKQKEMMRKKAEDNATVKINHNNEAEIARLQKELNKASQEIAMYRNSKSWKITEPLRKVYTMFHKE